MKLLKPAWVTHGPLLKDSSVGRPIYCLDLHPDGSRLATGGLIDTCGVVILWNMIPIRDPARDGDSNAPRKLFQMDNHQACVNCVRWSPSGRWLASAGMDKVIMLWKKTSAASRQTTMFGVKEQTTFTEHWRCASVLRGHTGDILDLAWSHDGYRLASAGVDNNVIVWTQQVVPDNPGANPFVMLTSLKAHQGFVKGLAWDPIGRYLASQGDEISVKIWRTSDWKEEAVIKKPFAKAVGQSQVMRISWSLDGSTLAAPHAINNGFPTAKLIDRTNWSSAFDLVGHRKHVICARYCPNLFHKSEKSGSQDLACLALGSKDRSVSVWTTADRRALVVIHDLFTNSVCDLTWSSSGTELMACSLDGTVSYMEFTSSELGTPWSIKDLVQLHHKSYGQSLLDSALSDHAPGSLNNLVVPCRTIHPGSDQADLILETPEALALQQSQAEVRQRLKDASPKTAAQIQRPQGPSKQIETRAKDGRRRIIPKFLGHLDCMDEDTGSHPRFQSTSPQSEKPLVTSDKVKISSSEPKAVTDITELKEGEQDTSISTSFSIPAAVTNATPPNSPSAANAPLSMVHASPPCVTVSIRRLSNLSKVSQPEPDKIAQDDTVPARSEPPVSPVDEISTKFKSLGKPKKRRRVRLFEDNEDNIVPEKKSTSQGKADTSVLGDTTSRSKTATDRDFVCPTSTSDGRRTASTFSLPLSTILVPDQVSAETKSHFVCSHPVEGPILVELCGQTPTAPVGTIPAQNELPVICRIVACRNDRTLWEMTNDMRITSYAHTDHAICFGDASGRIQLIHINGTRACSPMLLDSPVHRLHLHSLSEPPNNRSISESTSGSMSRLHSVISGRDVQEAPSIVDPEKTVHSVEYRLLGLCESGRLCIWHVTLPAVARPRNSTVFSTLVFPRLVMETNIREVIRGDASSQMGFSSLTLTSHGFPVVHRRDGSSYMFHVESRTWLELFSATSRIRCVAAIKASPNCPSGPLASYQMLNKLQGSASNHKLDGMKAGMSNEQRAIVRRFFEDQVQNAQHFGSAIEFRYWFTQWFRSLVEDNQGEQIRNICQGLIGPVVNTGRTSWQSTVKGISKHDLLRGLLPLFALNLRLQRLYVETKELLEQSESQTPVNIGSTNE